MSYPRYVQDTVAKWDKNDCDAITDHVLAGLTVDGYLAYPYTYLIRLVGGKYQAISSTGTLTYGGADDEGGADGDSWNDVMAAVDTALAAAGYGSIYLFSGNYTATDNFDLTADNVLLTGAARGVDIDFSGCAASTNSITVSGNNNTVSNLKISNSQYVGIMCTGDYITVHHCEAHDSVLQGINISGTDCRVQFCHVDSSGDYGIVIGGRVDGCIVSHNVVLNTADAGIEWGYSGHDVSISDNIVKDCNMGIAVYGTTWDSYTGEDTVKIVNNIIDNATTNGIKIEYRIGAPGGTEMKLFNIDNNIINTAGSYGIQVDDVTNSTIQNNHISNVTNAGIAALIDGLVIKNNHVNTSTYDGIYLPTSNSFTTTTIMDNTMTGIGRSPIRNIAGLGAGNIIKRNTGFITEEYGTMTGTSPISKALSLSGRPTSVALGATGTTPLTLSWVCPTTTLYIYHDAGASATVTYHAIYEP